MESKDKESPLDEKMELESIDDESIEYKKLGFFERLKLARNIHDKYYEIIGREHMLEKRFEELQLFEKLVEPLKQELSRREEEVSKKEREILLKEKELAKREKMLEEREKALDSYKEKDGATEQQKARDAVIIKHLNSLKTKIGIMNKALAQAERYQTESSEHADILKEINNIRYRMIAILIAYKDTLLPEECASTKINGKTIARVIKEQFYNMYANSRVIRKDETVR